MACSFGSGFVACICQVLGQPRCQIERQLNQILIDTNRGGWRWWWWKLDHRHQGREDDPRDERPDGDGRREPRHRGRPRADRSPRGPGVHGPAAPPRPDPGRDRERQGARGPVASQRRPAIRRPLRRRQLRGDPGDPARGGDVRLRAGRVHGCAPGQARALPDRAPGHALPGRDRPPAREPPGEAPDRPRGAHGAPPRGDAERAGRRVGHRGEQPRSPGRDPRGPLPRGPLSPARRPDPHAAAAPGAAGGHPAPGRALPRAGLRRLRARPEDARARCPGGARRLPVAGQHPRAHQHHGARRAAHRGARRDRGRPGPVRPRVHADRPRRPARGGGPAHAGRRRGYRRAGPCPGGARGDRLEHLARGRASRHLAEHDPLPHREARAPPRHVRPAAPRSASGRAIAVGPP